MPILPGTKNGSGWKPGQTQQAFGSGRGREAGSPILHFPLDEMMPGELAPTSLEADCVLSIEWIWRVQARHSDAAVAWVGDLRRTLIMS